MRHANCGGGHSDMLLAQDRVQWQSGGVQGGGATTGGPLGFGPFIAPHCAPRWGEGVNGFERPYQTGLGERLVG
jgi:hypothetical protein